MSHSPQNDWFTAAKIHHIRAGRASAQAAALTAWWGHGARPPAMQHHWGSERSAEWRLRRNWAEKHKCVGDIIGQGRRLDVAAHKTRAHQKWADLPVQKRGGCARDVAPHRPLALRQSRPTPDCRRPGQTTSSW